VKEAIAAAFHKIPPRMVDPQGVFYVTFLEAWKIYNGIECFEKTQNGCHFLGILFHVVHNGISAKAQETDRFRNKARLAIFVESVNDGLDALNLVCSEI